MKTLIPTFVIAVAFLPASCVAYFFTGPSSDLQPWLYLGIPLAWILALLGAAAFSLFVHNRSSRFRVTFFTIVAVLLFFPIRGFLVAAAEEITIRDRQQRNYQSDMGLNYMYAEMSGMGGASGFSHPAKIIEKWSFLAGISAVLWLPLAVFSSRLVSDAPSKTQPIA